MYLEKLRLRNFRSCADTTIHFNRDVTVLVGENNGGKTTVLDALRLLTTPSDGRRTRYPETRDINRDAKGAGLVLDAFFEDLSPSQKGWFLTALRSPTETAAQLGYEWTPPEPGIRRGRPTLTVGPRRSIDPEASTRDLIRHVHLPALRDAERDLASSAPGRIEFLLRHILGKDQHAEDALLDRAKSAFSTLMKEDPTLKSASKMVANEFDPLTDAFHPHKARLQFSDATLIGLARDLRFQLSQRGIDLVDIAQTGLGYANLLYLASVLVELAAAKDAELTLLLVEEPEAHLHPQLQAVTLDLLRKRARESRERKIEPGHHAGRIQVIVTTHSPNLASAVPCKHVVVLRSELPPDANESIGTEPSGDTADEGASEGVDAEEGSQSPPSQPRSPATQAVTVSRLGLAAPLLRKIDRYLDVTRSRMLFSRRVLLVEGLAEALLMPTFARQLFGSDSKEFDRFRAATIVAIDGVDFAPFVQLLLGTEASGGATAAERVVVITDDDSNADTEDDNDGANDEGAENGVDSTVADPLEATGELILGTAHGTPKNSPGIRRRTKLEQIAKKHGVLDRLDVFITPVTLEHALVVHCGENSDRLRLIESAYANLVTKPSAVDARRDKFKKLVSFQSTSLERANAFMKSIVDANIRKGDFAHLLASEIEPLDQKARNFGVPASLAEALQALVKV